jgi:DNA-directed RNA polymerase beta subunit
MRSLVWSKTIETGDKLATAQGLKFTVGEKINYSDMPMLVDVGDG